MYTFKQIRVGDLETTILFTSSTNAEMIRFAGLFWANNETSLAAIAYTQHNLGNIEPNFGELRKRLREIERDSFWEKFTVSFARQYTDWIPLFDYEIVYERDK